MKEQRIEALIESIPKIPEKDRWEQLAREHWKKIYNPDGQFDVIEEQIIKLCGLKQTLHPMIDKKWLIVMAGDHGIANEGLSIASPGETVKLVKSILGGNAISCILAEYSKCHIRVVDMGLSEDLPDFPLLIKEKVCKGTSNILDGPAMTREQAENSILAGLKTANTIASQGADLLVVGELGIGNTTAASTIASVMMNCSEEEVTGYGSGIDESKRQKKISLIKQAKEKNNASSKDPIGVLQSLGGFEIGGIVGLMIGSAKNGIPFLMDGFVVMSAFLIACSLSPNVRYWGFIGNHIPDDSNKLVANWVGLKPILHLPIRLGQGIGALLSIPLMEAALKVFSEMD